MSFFKKSIYALSLVGMAGLWSCSQEEMLSGGEAQTGQTVRLTLTVNRGEAQTRTSITEDETKGTLISEWADGDFLYVYDSGGNYVTTLDLVSGAGEKKAVFEGALHVEDGTYNYTFWYFKKKEGRIWETVDGQSSRVTVNLANQSFASAEELAEVEILSSNQDPNEWDETDFQIVVKDGKAEVTKDVELISRLAMARFKLNGLPSDASGSLEIYNADGKIYNECGFMFGTTSAGKRMADETGKGLTVSDVTYGKDVYVALIPCLTVAGNITEYRLGFRFTNDADGSVYEYEFEKPTVIEGGKYYCGKDGGGFEIPMEAVGDSEVPETPGYDPAADPDLVGKMFEVNDKKFRFTRANLKYTVETKEWSLMERQYSFICKGGWTLSNGTWCTTVNSAYQKVEPEIDMFGFGTTGLYDVESGETAQAPTFWRQTASQSYGNAAYYYPTNNTTINQGSGFIGSYLEHGTQFTNFDWGKAYQLNKNGEAYPSAEAPYTSYDKEKNPNVLRYFTLSSDDWTALQSKYFMTGATITGITNTVNTAAKNEIYGCLIIPIVGEGANSVEINNDKLAKVKALLEGKTTSVSTKLTTSLNFTGNNYQYFDYGYVKMTATQFDDLEKLGVVFLPEAGHKATDSYSKTDGYYWTSTAGQQYVSTFFRFDGNSSPRVFKLEGVNRSMGGAVRLVKEVPADYTDPVVVE